MSERSGLTALLFPGQGAHEPAMLHGVKRHPEFARRYQVVCDYAHTNVLRRIEEGDRELLNQNLHSSLITVLVSTLSLDIYRDRGGSVPRAYAGYSVGQWSAMHAAGMMSFEHLVAALVERARRMDHCVERQPGAMCAVIGLRENAVASVLEELRSQDYPVFIANYNCLGQYSISGTVQAIEQAEERLRLLKPKKLVRLPVSGAWHCLLLDDARKQFELALEKMEFNAPELPVIDNVTGEWLPSDNAQLRASLARHISHPVRWEKGIKTLSAFGCQRFVEIGYGSNLTKFGFFIDRQAEFSAFYDGGASVGRTSQSAMPVAKNVSTVNA